MAESLIRKYRSVVDPIYRRVLRDAGEAHTREFWSGYIDGLRVSLSVSSNHLKYVVYEEKGMVCIGLLLDPLGLIVGVGENVLGVGRSGSMILRSRVAYYLRERHPELSESDIHDFLDDLGTFKGSVSAFEERFGAEFAHESGYLRMLITNHSKFRLLDRSYRSYQHRDILPLFHLDFRKNEMAYVQGSRLQSNRVGLFQADGVFAKDEVFRAVTGMVHNTYNLPWGLAGLDVSYLRLDFPGQLPGGMLSLNL